MTETIDQQIEAIQIKPINLQQIAEEFIVALDWELKTGKPFTGQPIEAGKIRQFSLGMPNEYSFLPIARQMAEEIKQVTCGREGFMIMPIVRPGTDICVYGSSIDFSGGAIEISDGTEPVINSYSVIDSQTMRAARLIQFEGFIRFEVALEYRTVLAV